MTEKVMYKCDHCRKVMATTAGMERHEKQCIHNPNGHNCFNCTCSYVGDHENDHGHFIENCPMCAWTEDIIDVNIAMKCSEYRRTDKTFNSRTEEEAIDELPKEEAEAALAAQGGESDSK